MPIQNYAGPMGSMADVVSQPMNSFLSAQNRAQILQQRDQELARRDAQQNALMQQQQSEAQAAATTSQRKAQAQQVSASLLAMIDHPEIIPRILGSVEQQGQLPPTLQGWRQQHPDQLLADLKKEYITYRAQNADVLPQEPPAPDPVTVQQQGGYGYLQQGGKVVPGSVQAPQRAPVGGGKAGGPAPSGYTPDVIRNAAVLTLIDPTNMRQYATFGNTGQQARVDINNAQAAVMKEYGLRPEDVPALRARLAGQKKSTGELISMANKLDSFESVAKFNAQRILELLDKVDATGVPMIEGIRRKGAAALGGVDAAEFKSVLFTFQQEAARILSDPSMKGVVSDAARNEVRSLAPDSMTTEQGKRILHRLIAEMDFRKTSIAQQLDISSQNMTLGGNPAPEPAPTPPPPPANRPPLSSFQR